MASNTTPESKGLNLQTICNELVSVSHMWLQIGIQLGISRSILESFKNDTDPLSAVIECWLTGRFEVSWKKLVAALRAPAVEEAVLAEQIAARYCQKVSGALQSTSRLSQDASANLKYLLEKNLKEIIKKYGAFVDCLRLIIEQKGVTHEQLKGYLLPLSAFTTANYKGERFCLMSDKASELKRAKTVLEVFNFLVTECSSFLNCEIFFEIMKRFEIKKDQDDLKYDEHLKAYIEKHQVSEFMKINPLLKKKEGYKELTLKYDIDYTCRFAKVTELKSSIADIFNILPAAVHIVDISEGCIIVTFLIPSSVADKLFPSKSKLVITSQQSAKLKAASVVWMKCNGHYFQVAEGEVTVEENPKMVSRNSTGAENIAVCKNCFYKYRTSQMIPECHHNGKEIVKWNDAEGRFETTTCRPFPPSLPSGIKNSIAMCDPYRGNCKREKCTFAHGRMEQKAWNSILRQQRGQDMSQFEEAQIPTFTEEQWPDLHIAPGHIKSYSPLPSTPAFQSGVSQVARQVGNYGAAGETFEERLKEELKLDVIKVPLNRTNYKKKFNNLLCWEEMTHIRTLTEKCDLTCELVVYKKGFIPRIFQSQEKNGPYQMRYGYIKDFGADRLSYAIQASEAAVIVSQKESVKSEVRLDILNEYSSENLYVAFRESSSSELSSIVSQPLLAEEVVLKKVRIEFEVKHSYFNSLIQAVNRIDPAIVERILPNSDDFESLIKIDSIESILKLVSVSIDQDQRNALYTILSCARKSPPIVVNGSFGSGKTRLLAVATCSVIHYGIQHGAPVRVLVCAHHQLSADHFIEQYFGKMFRDMHKVELKRITSKIHRHDHSKFQNVYVRVQSYINEVSRKKVSSMYFVAVTTFLTAAHLLRIFPAGHFTHILIDEGSQTREPEAISPLCLAGPETKIVIAGDTCQVGPSLLVLGEEARENGLKFSLIERLQALYKEYGGLATHHMISLSTNYRCHQDLIKIPNDLFYESKIKSHPDVDALSHPATKFPLVFVCSSITEQVDYQAEARILLKQVHSFIESQWPNSWGEQKNFNDVGIITASQHQLVRTKKLARNLRGVRFATTFRLQGEEFRAIFLSTTEPVDADGNTTNPTKSPCDPYVFNTVLTRSKSLVVTVGSPLALLGIEKHMKTQYGRKGQCWSSYFKQCLLENTFIVPDEVAEPNEREQFKLKLKEMIFHEPPTSIPHFGEVAEREEAKMLTAETERDTMRRVAEAERRAEEAERRAEEAERRAVIREQEAKRKVEEAEKRAKEAEKREEETVKMAKIKENEANGRAEVAEKRAKEAERREEEAERREEEAERREQEAERRKEEAETGEREAERREQSAKRALLEAERKAKEAKKKAEEMNKAFLEVKQEAKASETKVEQQQASSVELQWLVKKSEIQTTEEVLGNGAWGEVRVAVFRGTRVAAKSLHSTLIDAGDFYKIVFIREINMAARLRHPNLVQFIGACMDDTNKIILTELLPTSLRKTLEQKYSFSSDQLKSISLDVTRALSYLHQMQPDPVIHRDISSANVLLEPLAGDHWRAKVADYGSVNFQEKLNSVMPGASIYASPEAHDPQMQSPKMDIFSFGILLIEMCTGQLPEIKARQDMIDSIQSHKWKSLIQSCIEARESRPSAIKLINVIESIK